MEDTPKQEQQVQKTNVQEQESEFREKQYYENRRNNLKNRELQESKSRFFNVAKNCIGWLTFIIINATIYMCLFAAHYATPVRGVEAEITDYRKSSYNSNRNETEPASVSVSLKNTNHFKVTVDFFITYRDSKVSKRITVVLSAFEDSYRSSGYLTLYRDLNFGDNVSKDDFEINMTATCNSHSYFGSPIGK